MNYQEYFFPWLLNMFKATLSPFLCQPVCLLVTCVPVISTIQGQGLFWHFPHQVSFLDFCYKTSSLFSTLIFDSPFSFFFFSIWLFFYLFKNECFSKLHAGRGHYLVAFVPSGSATVLDTYEKQYLLCNLVNICGQINFCPRSLFSRYSTLTSRCYLQNNMFQNSLTR